MKEILLIFVLCSSFYQSLANDLKPVYDDEYSDYNENIYENYIKMDKQLKNMADVSVKKLIPYLQEIRENVNISTTCVRNIHELINGFKKLTTWSISFLDSFGKIQSGILTGNTQMFGEYGECIETTVMKKGKIDFQGKYCSLTLKPHLPKLKKPPGIYNNLEGLVNATQNTSDVMKLIVSRIHVFYALDIKLGICVPSGCTQNDISEIMKYSFRQYTNATVSYCLKKGDIYYWTAKRIIIVSIFTLFGMIMVLSTLLDNTLETWKKNNPGPKSRILQCFSLTRNFSKLMNTNLSENSITCFNGTRVLSMFWIILGHQYTLQGLLLTTNHALNFEKMLSSFFAQIIWNGNGVVDIFFFMSGFLNAYIRVLIKQEGRSQPSILKLIVHRLWRIYPAYITSFLLFYLLNNPPPYHYQLQQALTANCNLYWWQNILFINNFFNPVKMCMPQSWFICVDMQFFLMTLFTIPLLWRKPKLGIILHITIILIASFGSMTWRLVNDIAPIFTGARLDRKELIKTLISHVYPPDHVGSYFIGILFGYAMAIKKDIKIPKVIQILGGLAASLLYTSTLFVTVKWTSGNPYTQIGGSLYGAFYRTSMVLGFSWLVFCCITGHARLFNYILSLRLWIPLARITYMMYLTSVIIQAHYAGHANFPEDFYNMSMVCNYLGNLFISILMSFALVLMIESPVIAMQKVIFQNKQDEQKSSPEVPKEMIMSNNIKENGFSENEKTITIHL